MADLADVANAIAGIASAALYPNGTSQPSAVNVDCKVVRGWPLPDDLDASLKAGTLTVSVFPMQGMERNTTRFPTDLNTLNIPAATITAVVSGQQITFGGTVSAPQNIGVILGDYDPTQTAYVYPATVQDTPTTIAAGLAALLVAAGIAATASGPVLTLPAKVIAEPKIGVFGTAWQELKRQERAFMVSLWCSTPDLRDRAGPIIDLAMVRNERFELADGSCARMTYVRTDESDDRQTVAIYRRDLIYMVEYPTTVISTYPTIISTNAASELSH